VVDCGTFRAVHGTAGRHRLAARRHLRRPARQPRRFTALYGANRPYASRAGHLAVVAVCFAVAVGLGDGAASSPWLGVLAVSVISMIATLLCNALAVGPPGAYIFVLACAVGVGVAVRHVSPWHVGLLVLSGGALAWVVHMAGVVRGFRRPERTAVAAAGRAVASYVEKVGTDEETTARRTAADALHRSWVALVNFQPAVIPAGRTLQRLRLANRRLHLLFANAMWAAAAGRAADSQWAEQARRLASADDAIADSNVRIPLGGPSVARRLREAMRPRSGQLRVVARVGVAVVIAGTAASLLGIDRAYWAMATAVLVLHQGFDRRRTLRRGIERSIGTCVGLVLAGVLLDIHPQGLWLAGVLAVLQFAIEMLVIPFYAGAAVFITAAALLIGSGGRPVADVADLLLTRGVDTFIGAGVAVVVYLATARGHDVVRLSETIAQTLESVNAVARYLADDDVTRPEALTARRDLQLRALDLQQAYHAAVVGSPRLRDRAERLWPLVAAAEDTSYRMLAMCWAREQGTVTDAEKQWGTAEVEHIEDIVTDLARAVRAGGPIHGVESLLRVTSQAW
jgi:uncharacterized membrane protein YccC